MIKAIAEVPIIAAIVLLYAGMILAAVLMDPNRKD